eukprot:1693402-Pyramimonas_sp.AAC.1
MGRSASRRPRSVERKRVSFERPWSRCSACRRCEWDDLLEAQSWRCSCGPGGAPGAGGTAAHQLQRPGAPARDSSVPPELAAALR